MSQRVMALLELLDGVGVRDRIRQMIVEFGCVTPEDTETLCTSIDRRLRGIRASLHDVCMDGDTSEAEAMLLWICLEMRMEWMRYNSQMQYQTVMQGSADPVLMARGAALSFLLEALDRKLDATQLYTVSRIAEDPQGVALAAVSRTDRLFSVMARASRGGREAVDSLLAAQDKITRSAKSGPVQHDLTEAIGTVMQTVGDALRVTSEDFSHALQGVLLRELGHAPVLVLLENVSRQADAQLPSAVAIGLLGAAGTWMAALSATSLQMSADARISAGRPAFVTLAWNLSEDGDQVALELRDDADGTVSFKTNSQDWPIRDLVLHVVQQPGHGSTLRISCQVTTIADYLLLRVGRGEHDVLIGVPSQTIMHIEQRDGSAVAVGGTTLIDRLDGGAHALVDLGEMLFDSPVEPDGATYVLVRHGEGPNSSIAFRVRGVHGIRRGTMKPVPSALKGAPVRGFVVTGHDITAVLDVASIVQRCGRERGRPETASAVMNFDDQLVLA